jgi:hypothetical protein
MVIVVVVMIVAMVAVIVMTFAVIVAVVVPMFVTMVFTIVRNVGIGVPVMPNEVDRLAAGVVFAAVMAPIVLIAWADVQIDRRRQWVATNTYAYDGRAIDEARRRRIADVHASVKAGVAQADGGRHLCERCAAHCQGCKSHREK